MVKMKVEDEMTMRLKLHKNKKGKTKERKYISS